MDDTKRQKVRDLFATGMVNAHALEKQAHTVMSQQAPKLSDYPDLKARVEQHIRETEAQIARLEEGLRRVGHAPSAFRDAAMQVMGAAQAMTHMFAQDDVIKATIANQGVEAFEIASYVSLIELAERSGEAETKADLEKSLAEERDMFHWLEQHVQPITVRYTEVAFGAG